MREFAFDMDDIGVSWAIMCWGKLSQNIIICFVQWNYERVDFKKKYPSFFPGDIKILLASHKNNRDGKTSNHLEENGDRQKRIHFTRVRPMINLPQ